MPSRPGLLRQCQQGLAPHEDSVQPFFIDIWDGFNSLSSDDNILSVHLRKLSKSTFASEDLLRRAC